MEKKILVAGCILLAMVVGSFVGTAQAEDQFITVHWAQWAPADYLQKLSEGFTEETGIKVIVEQTPWTTFVQKYNVEMVAKSDAWDIIVGDSQDLGTMAVSGHYVDLTDWVIEKGVRDNFTAASLESYSEYPKNSGTYWSIPLEGDAIGWAYRKDLFEDPENMAAFKEKYGYDLAVPSDLAQMADIAEFFNDPDNDFYGIAIYGDDGYDAHMSVAEMMIWNAGGDIGDMTTMKVDGILNSPESAAGLEFYKKLFQFTPPGFEDAFFIKVSDAYTAGIVPMAGNFFAFFPGLANPATNPYAEATGYFSTPPMLGSDGVKRQYTALGGQGASVVKYSKKQDLAMQWMDWFIRPEVQMEWAKLGGYTCHIDTLESEAFLDATPYNAAFKESMNIMKDFWNVPEYSELRGIFNETLGKYVIRGEGTAQEALDACVVKWEQVFKDAGYYDK